MRARTELAATIGQAFAVIFGVRWGGFNATKRALSPQPGWGAPCTSGK